MGWGYHIPASVRLIAGFLCAERVGLRSLLYTPVEEEKNGRDSAQKLPFFHVFSLFLYQLWLWFLQINLYLLR